MIRGMSGLAGNRRRRLEFSQGITLEVPDLPKILPKNHGIPGKHQKVTEHSAIPGRVSESCRLGPQRRPTIGFSKGNQ